jgi:aryl-alcohol dehydrogenase-like predicted oxidoreductase
MITAEFRANRLNFPEAELEKYRGQWVAFSPDGLLVVAGADTIEQLEEKLEVQNLDLHVVVLEHVPEPDEYIGLGGEEFG